SAADPDAVVTYLARFSFLSPGPAPLRPLHSFPTRRSSDLPVQFDQIQRWTAQHTHLLSAWHARCVPEHYDSCVNFVMKPVAHNIPNPVADRTCHAGTRVDSRCHFPHRRGHEAATPAGYDNPHSH